MKSLEHRVRAARNFVRHPRIVVTDIETELGTRYTADTLVALRLRYPSTRFVWIMGADNLIQIRRWQHWRQIFHMTPVAVYDRPPYSLRAQCSLAARRFAVSRVTGTTLNGLGTARPPRWGFFHTRLNAISSTAIRHAASKGTDHRDDR